MTIDKEFNKIKREVFFSSNKNASFLGSILCSVEFLWTDSEEIPTAATDGLKLWWNRKFFESLNKDSRVFVLLHELWHVAFLHAHRRGKRDPEIWNIAADYCINGFLVEEGRKCSVKFLHDTRYKGMSTEEIYDLIIENAIKIPFNPMKDIIDGEPSSLNDAVGKVIYAQQLSEMSKEAGTRPGEIEVILNTFLKPKIPWESVLMNFFTALSEEDYSWSKPNRRYRDEYLPSMVGSEGLEHIIYYLDVSGSIRDIDITRFNSEVKYIKEVLNPEKLTLVQFDTRITQETVYEKDDPFESVHVIGRGGTSLVPVREHILANNPNAVVIFSDLEVTPMEGGITCPVIWVTINNPGATVPFGEMIHIDE